MVAGSSRWQSARGSRGVVEPDLTVVVPAFNESARIDTGRERLERAVEDGAIDSDRTELIVVDDGSTDGTAVAAEEAFGDLANVVVLALAKNTGKGAAVRAGIERARAPIVAFMDADMAIDPWQVRLLAEALSGSDVAIGTRSLPGSSADGDTLFRNVMGKVFNGLVSSVTGIGIADTQCGFKGFRTPVARLLFASTVIERFAFDVELLYTARRFGLRIAKVPVHWRNVGGSRIRLLRDPMSMLSDLTRSRLRLSTPPWIDGLDIPRAALGENAVKEAVGSILPVLERDGGGALVLFPLCSTEEKRGATAEIAAGIGEASLHPVRVTVNDLAAMAPLTVVDVGHLGEENGAGARAPSDERSGVSHAGTDRS